MKTPNLAAAVRSALAYQPNGPCIGSRPNYCESHRSFWSGDEFTGCDAEVASRIVRLQDVSDALPAHSINPTWSDDELSLIRTALVDYAVRRRESSSSRLSARFAEVAEDVAFKADDALKARGSHHNADVADEERCDA